MNLGMSGRDWVEDKELRGWDVGAYGNHQESRWNNGGERGSEPGSCHHQRLKCRLVITQGWQGQRSCCNCCWKDCYHRSLVRRACRATGATQGSPRFRREVGVAGGNMARVFIVVSMGKNKQARWGIQI